MKYLLLVFAFFALFSCVGHEDNFEPSGVLLNTSIGFDSNEWELKVNSTDSIGGRNFAIQSKHHSIVLGITERPDNTRNIKLAVLLEQLESGQKKNFSKFETVLPSGTHKMVKLPKGWECKNYLAQKIENSQTQYYTNCIVLADAAWSNLVILRPVEMSTEEANVINLALSKLKFSAAGKKP